jgi:hypothetical protein
MTPNNPSDPPRKPKFPGDGGLLGFLSRPGGMPEVAQVGPSSPPPRTHMDRRREAWHEILICHQGTEH